MQIPFGWVIGGIIVGVAIAHILTRVQLGGGKVQQAPSGQWPN